MTIMSTVHGDEVLSTLDLMFPVRGAEYSVQKSEAHLVPDKICEALRFAFNEGWVTHERQAMPGWISYSLTRVGQREIDSYLRRRMPRES